MDTNSSIGIGIITCNRPDYLKKLLDSIAHCNWAEFIIVNDGDKLDLADYNHYIHHNETNLGVGKSKNIAMQHLLDKGCDYIFIIEDDMIILDDSVFQKYIKAYKVTGIHHMMFAYHGPANKNGISGGKPYPRKIIDYGKLQIALNQHCVGAFCFYTRECLEAVGLNDEYYLNAFEHVDHSYRLAKADFSTPYWWWSDLANSSEYIGEQACSETSSTIRPRSDWQENIQKSALYFTKQHGLSPVQVPDTSIADIINKLKRVKYAT